MAPGRRTTNQSYLDAIRSAWSPETCAGEFDPNCRSRGQCAVTALLIQDWFGGELLRTVVKVESWEQLDHAEWWVWYGESHYWNRIPDMGEIDLTREQYSPMQEISRGVVVPRSYLLGDERAIAAQTSARYRTLAEVAHKLVRSAGYTGSHSNPNKSSDLLAAITSATKPGSDLISLSEVSLAYHKRKVSNATNQKLRDQLTKLGLVYIPYKKKWQLPQSPGPT